MNGHRTLPGAFTASIEMTVVIFPWCINLHVLSQPYIPEENPTRSWHMILTHCSTWFASILLRIFTCVHQRYWPIVFFLVSLSGVGIRWCCFIKWVWKCSLCYFFKYLKGTNINSLTGRTQPWSHLVQGFSFWGALWLLLNLLIRYWPIQACFLPETVLVGCVFLGTYPFLLGYPASPCVITRDGPSWPSFSQPPTVTSPRSFLIVVFSLSPAWGLLVLYTFSKPRLSLTAFLLFSIFYLFCFCSDLYHFPSLCQLWV